MVAKLEEQNNEYIQKFAVVRVRNIKDYAKPCIRDGDPEHHFSWCNEWVECEKQLSKSR